MNNSTYDDSGNDFKTADTFFFTIKMIKNGPLEMSTVYIYLKFKVQNNLS